MLLTLIHALYRVMRIYDHSDALMYEEMLIESANEDDEENRSQYEISRGGGKLCRSASRKHSKRSGDSKIAACCAPTAKGPTGPGLII